jgi:DNA-binding transcriptional LysR family regulator
LVSETDHLVTLPRQLAEQAARHFPLRVMELPIPVEGFSIGLHWRSTRDKDPEHASLRNYILATLSPG